jgi:DNA replication protein DnaC
MSQDNSRQIPKSVIFERELYEGQVTAGLFPNYGRITQDWGISNVPRRFRDQLEKVDRSGPWGEKFVMLLAQMRQGVNGSIYALIGTRGRGKTMMAVCLMRAAAERGVCAQYTTAFEIFLKLKGAFRKDSETTERSIIDDLCAPAVLVIDEHHERGETDWENRILTHILDRRYASMLDTIIISNQTREIFQAAIGASVWDRMGEAGGVIVCDWQNYRIKP